MSVSSILTRVLQLEQQLATEIKSLKTAMEFNSMASTMDSMAAALEKEPIMTKNKKAKPEGQEKAKRAPNSWILFTKRLDALFKSREMKVGGRVCLLFASHLKKESAETKLEGLQDEQILEQFQTFTPPPVEKKSVSETSSVVSGDEKPKKERKPQSEETKAAAAIKRAATKAAKAAASASESETETAVKPKKKIAAIAAKPQSLNFSPFLYEGEDCWQNERGDTLNPEGDWMGRFEGGKLTTMEQPEDLEAAIAELME